MKEVFTTTEVARICHISKQKIVNLFDQGVIEGFRIPGPKGSNSWARRIPRKSLIEFMRRHNIPTDKLDRYQEAEKRKILIVEDDRQSVELLEALLEGLRERVEIKVARSGSEAAFLLGSFKPDILLLDIMLPDVDGDEILSRLEKEGMVGQIEIIVLTALKDEERKRALMERGVTHYMTKPIDTQEFLRVVRTMLCGGTPENGTNAESNGG